MTSSTRHAFTPFSNGGSNPLYLEAKDEKDNAGDDRSQLIDLFQTYADMYPNPRLIEEYRLRDKLQQAASAASAAVRREKNQSEKSRGFFNRWWFGDVDDSKPGEHLSASDGSAATMSEDPLLYLDSDSDAGTEYDKLCGTTHGLDLDCVPIEVYSLARFHLTSTRTRDDRANVFRQGVAFSSSTLSLVVVGLGEIAELSTQKEPCLFKTSDRDMLLLYAETKENFTLSYVRATVITDNCIAVSWGFSDGIIIIYRRVKSSTSSTGWEAVWTMGPSNGVLENMRVREFFHDDEDHPGSPLLRVSDCLPLQFETGQQSEPVIITLALARLGGYIELIPLPRSVRDGPLLEQNTKSAPNFGSRGMIGHYTSGHSIECPPNTLALTTSQCHIDVLSLQALQTTANANTPWDDDAFPDSPPSQYIMCASGMNENGLEVISFWATSIFFPDTQDQRYRMHSSLIEVITTKTGADISFFVTPGIMRRWRKPRSVAIRQNLNLESPLAASSEVRSAFQKRITTISITAPIVKIELSVIRSFEHDARLTAMDWNGGVVILDCSLIGSFASQSISKEELNTYQNAENPVSMVKTIATRNQIMNILQKTELVSRNAKKRQSTVKVCDMKWVENADHPCLILLAKVFENTVLVALSAKLSLLFATLIAKGEAIKLFGTSKLTLIAKRNGKKGKTFRHFGLQELQSEEMEHAALAPDSPDGTKMINLSSNSRGSQSKIWLLSRDVRTLATNQDPVIVVPETLSIIHCGDAGGTMTVESLRMICRHAIRTGGNAEMGMKNQMQEINSFLVKLGTFQLLCQHLCIDPSLTRFQEKFQNVSLADIAQNFAARADLSALTIVIYRHPFDFDEYMKILDKIPLSTDPASFSHLVPVFRKGSITRCFLFRDGEDKIVSANWSHMPPFARQSFGIRLALDHEDGVNALEVFMNEDTNRDSAGMFRLWLYARAKLMQSFVGNTKHAILLLKLGMHSEAQERNNKFEEVTDIFQSHRHHSTLMSFIIEVGEFMVDGEGIVNESGTDDLISMKEEQIVEITLKGRNHQAQIVDKCFRLLRPMAVIMAHGEDTNFDLDNAISSFCIGLVDNCCASPLKKKSTKLWFQSFLSSTSICVGIAEESRTSKPRELRIIRQKTELVRMVKSIFLLSVFTLRDLNISPQSSKIFLNTFWQLCETLPAPMPVQFPATSEHDVLFCVNALLGFEIISHWPGCNPLSFLAQFCHLQNVSDRNIEELGFTFMIQMFESYCAQVKECVPHKALEALMEDLLEDTTNLNIFCFRGSIDIPLILTKHLIPILLKIKAFDAVVTLLDRHSKFIDFVGVEVEVLKLIEDAILVEGGTSDRKISWFGDNASEIKRIFPECAEVLDPLDRCIKASLFINSFIFKGSSDIEPMAPITLKHVLPLDLIDCVVDLVPRSVVYICPQWQQMQDREHESKANEAEDVLVRIGDSILYLAAILGCTDECSQATVKCKVVQVSIEEGFHEAAIILCQSMIQEWKESTNKNFAVAAVIGIAIHSISMVESSMNVRATRELYQNFLREIYCSTRLTFSSLVFDILTQSVPLDFQYICFSSDQKRIGSMVQESILSPSFLEDRHQSRLKMLLLDFHRLISVGKLQDSTISNLCMELIDMHIASSKIGDRFLERHFPAHFVFFSCILVLHISDIVPLTTLLTDLIEIVNTLPFHCHEDSHAMMSNFSSVPDTQIVHELTRRGYSKCAAGRAATMSGNQGNQAAQEWALAHMLQVESNEPFLNILSARAEKDDKSIHILRKVFQMVESFGDSGPAWQNFKMMFFQISQSHNTADYQCHPKNQTSRDALNKSMRQKLRSRNVRLASGQQIETNDTKLSGWDRRPKPIHKKSQNPSIVRVELLDRHQNLASGAILSGQSALTSRIPETRQQPLSDNIIGSTRGRLIEEGRFLLQKTMRKKRSSVPSMARSAH